MATANSSVLALDFGGRRIGVAVTSLEARLAQPLTTLANDDVLWQSLEKIITDQDVTMIVVGLPRSLEGQATDQTAAAQDFAADLKSRFNLPVELQDEAVTSQQAQAELEARGKAYKREEVDALAATYILEDWLSQNQGKID